MKRNVLVFACVFGVSLTAVPAIAHPDAAPVATKSGSLPAAPSDKAQIIFYRPGSMVGAAMGCTVHEGTAEIARLGSGKYWIHSAQPGKHIFFTQAENTDVLHMEVEAGETYYVRCKIGMGIMAGRPNISPSTAEEFAKKAPGLKLWEPKGKAAEGLEQAAASH